MLIKQNELSKITGFFSCLSDETRLKIILSILEQPKTVNEIHQMLGEEKLALSAVSHQLTLMSNLGIVEFEKTGRSKSFRLSKQFCWCILRKALGHFEEKGGCKACQEAKKLNPIREFKSSFRI
ncbi:winged helix-turn-helix transcriptional regulator [Candidatus Woesearchaeota archaeon]|nr:winged helix-turn-helix transcriptional regulator [Candidatus Woesearchaeota archaeon]